MNKNKSCEELIEEHRQGRMAVTDLVEAKGRYLRGDPEGLAFYAKADAVSG